MPKCQSQLQMRNSASTIRKKTFFRIFRSRPKTLKGAVLNVSSRRKRKIIMKPARLSRSLLSQIKDLCTFSSTLFLFLQNQNCIFSEVTFAITEENFSNIFVWKNGPTQYIVLNTWRILNNVQAWQNSIAGEFVINVRLNLQAYSL